MNRNIEMCYKWLYRVSLVSLLVLFNNSTTKRPTDEAGLIVPEGFTIERVVETGLLSYPMLASFDPDGRLFVFESTGPNTMGSEEMLRKPSYQVRLLEDTNQDGKFDKGTVYADSIPFPKGGVFYQGSLYVAEAPNLAKYTDINGDGVSDKKEIILSGWNFHSNGATLSGPFLGPDGWLYLTDARRGFNIKTKEGNILSGKATRIWRCRPDGTGLEALAGGGFDNSIELAFMPSGETVGTMTYFINPQDGQRDAIMHWVEGGTYPKPNPVIAEDKLKLTGDLMPVMTKLARVAPSGIMRYQGAAWGKGYQDNLFTAEFNTGRIMRYIVEKDGSTFKTTNEVFLKSSFPDSHPTDVLQDADGSMLVIVTGGWFSEGCPLSRVAKPDLKGGIYRIRKIDAPKESDPYGKDLALKNLPPENLVRYLTDSRPAVRDKATNKLIEKGKASVAVIVETLPKIEDAEIRAAALFALSRVSSEDALSGVRNSLYDKSTVVRTAAARALGLARDKKAVEKLCDMVKSDSIAARRQAATALGQIGDPKAIEALLSASGGENDRVLNHAIIHALIILKDPSQVISALSDPSPKVRAAAMIALDQMDGSPLTKEQLAPALASKDSLVRNTGIWVASHHPEWTDLIVDFLEKTLRRNDITTMEMVSMQDIMFTFIKEPRLQNFIAEQLINPNLSATRKSLTIDVIDKCALKELPDSWIKGINQLLYSKEPFLQSRVFALIESRRITVLKNTLDQIISDPRLSLDIRLKSLSARVISLPRLSDNEFALLMKCMGPENNSPLRQRAVRVLGYTELTDLQLLKIAQTQIPHADPFLLPGLMQVFEGSASEQAGNALINGIEAGIGRLDNVSEQDLQRLLKTFPASVHRRAEPLMARIRAKNSERLSHLKKLESELKGGDVGEGRKLFFGKASCYLCHAVGPDGGRFGPDLTNIGEIRSKHDMLEAIVYPSASFAREYETFRVVTNTTAYVGIIKEELPDVIVLEVGPAPGLRIPRSEIKSIEPHTTSMMPPGLDQALTISEMANLTAFLEALPYRIDRMLKIKENR